MALKLLLIMDFDKTQLLTAEEKLITRLLYNLQIKMIFPLFGSKFPYQPQKF